MNKSGFAWCILLALAFTGCQGDQEGKHHFDNKVFISAASYTPEVRVMRDALDVTEEHTCEITVAMAQPVAQDITVSFAEAPELLDRYRTFYDDPTAQLLPGDITTFRRFRPSSGRGWSRASRSPLRSKSSTNCLSKTRSVTCFR